MGHSPQFTVVMASSSDICRWINELKNADTRESALQELSRMTDAEEDWHSGSGIAMGPERR